LIISCPRKGARNHHRGECFMKKISKKFLVIGIITAIAIVAPILSINKIEGSPPIGDLIFYGYVYDHTGDAVVGASVKIKCGTAVWASTTTSSTGYYYVKTLTMPMGETIKLEASKTGYDTQYSSYSDNPGTRTKTFYIAPTNVEKIAAFFYATDATTSAYMQSYGNQLINEEGFDTVLYYEDPTDWEGNIDDDIDPLEDSDTFVFIYFCAHGAYDGSNSYMQMSKYWVVDWWIFGHWEYRYCYSNALNTAIDTHLESENIMVLVESCHSGGFVDDLKGSGMHVIATTDHDNVAYCVSAVPSVGVFTQGFFTRLNYGYNDGLAYSFARQDAINAHSDQNPMHDDQCVYNWFQYW